MKFKAQFARRFEQAASPKIIISGMRHFEAFLDNQGDYIAGKSTVILRNVAENLNVEFLLGFLNSSLATFYLKECFGALAMDGGISFTPNNVSEIPVADVTPKQQAPIVKLVDQILAAKRDDPQADVGRWEREIDRLVYKLYALTDAEIAIVEGSTK